MLVIDMSLLRHVSGFHSHVRLRKKKTQDADSCSAKLEASKKQYSTNRGWGGGGVLTEA